MSKIMNISFQRVKDISQLERGSIIIVRLPVSKDWRIEKWERTVLINHLAVYHVVEVNNEI